MFHRTRRLLLRPGFPEDAAALARALGDERIVKNLARVPWPYAIDDANAFLSRFQSGPLPSFLITLRTDAAPLLIGACGLARSESGAVEIGYWIAKDHMGQGYATEACEGLLEIAGILKLNPIEAGCFIDNPASRRVLEKLGFAPTGERRSVHSSGRGGPVMADIFTQGHVRETSETLAA